MYSTNDEFEITLEGDAETRGVHLNGKRLDPAPSQKIRNHSPDGFNWGYGGSGPAQLALAICLELYGKQGQEVYQDFKWRYIERLPLGKDFDEKIKIWKFKTYVQEK